MSITLREHSVVSSVTLCNSKIHGEVFCRSLRVQPAVITITVVLGDLPGADVWHPESRGDKKVTQEEIPAGTQSRDSGSLVGVGEQLSRGGFGEEGLR